MLFRCNRCGHTTRRSPYLPSGDPCLNCSVGKMYRSAAMQEGSDLINELNTGIESFKEKACGCGQAIYCFQCTPREDKVPDFSNTQSGFETPDDIDQEPSYEMLEINYATLESTLRKYLRLVWFQQGTIELDNEAFSDGKFDPAEWLTLTSLRDKVVATEKEKKS